MKQAFPYKKLSESAHAYILVWAKKWYGGGNSIDMSNQNAKIDEK